MPRRTKQWWAALDEPERSWLVRIERENWGSGYGAGGYLPDDCSECSGCGQPMFGSGWCSDCYTKWRRITEKGNVAVEAML